MYALGCIVMACSIPSCTNICSLMLDLNIPSIVYNDNMCASGTSLADRYPTTDEERQSLHYRLDLQDVT